MLGISFPKVLRRGKEQREGRVDCMVKLKSRSMYALVLALSLIFSGVYLWAYSSVRQSQDEDEDAEYREAMEKYRQENVHYDPGEIVEYIASCQNSQGYFVNNPDLVNEPDERNSKTLITTRFAISILSLFDSLESIDHKATLNYLMDCYVPNIEFTHSLLGNISYHKPGEGNVLQDFGEAMRTHRESGQHWRH